MKQVFIIMIAGLGMMACNSGTDSGKTADTIDKNQKITDTPAPVNTVIDTQWKHKGKTISIDTAIRKKQQKAAKK